MQSGIFHRSHSTPFHTLLHNHPWPSTFPLRISSLSYPRGASDSVLRNSGRKRDGERIWKAKKMNRRWWSDDWASREEDFTPGILEEFVGSLWFVKVMGSYGWFSPFIIISLLAASGPKAFLMAFSIPFGINLLTFVSKKLWRWIQSNTNYKPTSKPKTENVNAMIEEEEEEIQIESVNSNGSSPSFGGWEELIDERELKARRAKRRTEAKKTRSVPLKERMEELQKKVKGERDLPLLLKLLVAVFPFLSFWTELL